MEADGSLRYAGDTMGRPTKLANDAVDTWLSAHPGWERRGEALVKGYKLADFSAALGLVVRVGLAAEKKDHHPDVELGWGKASFLWTTHDAGGITSLDLELASICDALAKG